MTAWPSSIAFPLTLLVSVALILTFEVVTARIAAHDASFPYKKLWMLQLFLYVVIGFCAMVPLLELRRVEIVGAITAFVDATFGWAITWRIGPGRVANATPANIAVAVFSITAFGFGCTIIGALVFTTAAHLLVHSPG